MIPLRRVKSGKALSPLHHPYHGSIINTDEAGSLVKQVTDDFSFLPHPNPSPSGEGL
jgi:hypothetical protein